MKRKDEVTDCDGAAGCWVHITTHTLKRWLRKAKKTGAADCHTIRRPDIANDLAIDIIHVLGEGPT